jgi:peroxiredoxin
MYRIFTATAALIIVIITTGYSQENRSILNNSRDTVTIHNIYRDIDNYISRANPHPDSLIAACNRLISLTDNTALKTAIAGYLFNTFSTSPVMGQESVAIYIAKKYFLSGELEWHGEGGEAILRLYTEFNQNSLIGMKAPELNLQTITGEEIALKSLKTNYTVIYFFDNNCSVCKAKLPDLKKVTELRNYLGIEVYAVYTGQDTLSLLQFIAEEFPVESSDRKIKWHFVYDPDGMSGFHKLYNVLSTPQMFLLDREKKIIGRNLDASALEQVFESDEQRINNLYNESENFVPAYLSIFDLKDTSQFKEAFDPLFQRATRDNYDTYNAIFYHLFEFLFNEDDPAFKYAAVYVAEKYIIPYTSLWRDPDYPQNIVLTKVSVIKNNRVGSVIPDVTLYTTKGRAKKIKKMLTGHTLLYFFNPDCSVCTPFTEELKENFKYFKKHGLRIIAIYAGSYDDELFKYINVINPPWKILRPKDYNYLDLYKIFEVGQVPQTYLLDKKGRIIAKRIFTAQLKEMFK